MIRVAAVRQVTGRILKRVMCEFSEALARIIGRELDPRLDLCGVQVGLPAFLETLQMFGLHRRGAVAEPALDLDPVRLIEQSRRRGSWHRAAIDGTAPFR